MSINDAVINQAKLQILSVKLMERFDDVMQCLNITLDKQKKMYVGTCPIHGGDKFNAFNIYHAGDNCIGNWKCRTQQCEKYFVGSVIGLIRGVLSHQKYGWNGPGDKKATFAETLQFITKCLNEDYQNINIDFKALEQSQFIKMVNLCCENIEASKNIDKHIFCQDLNIPANYFIKRGFSENILKKYDIGDCKNPRNSLYNRSIVPIYNNNHTYIIGNTSRSMFEKCQYCGTWHNPKYTCPTKNEAFKYAKWIHSYGFKKENHLYNYWFAASHIHKSLVCVLTESPGNIWRLEEAGIHTGLATFGASLCDGQKKLLNKTGAMTLILAMDNDAAGKQCVDDIINTCSKIYKIYTFTPTKNDIADMTIDEIQKQLLPLYNQCVKEVCL